ncbi:MAG: sulfatase-like hydrolase/transferase [Thermodesulfobacteriota bacterium]|nr:sulfatase-like hydrolase/transferase [Thermodesulfobacteriota bacterium]
MVQGNARLKFFKDSRGLICDEIKYVDTEIEIFFNKLKELDIFENSIIIFSSDHGEAFNEHDSFSHRNLYDEILRVPLIIRFPQTLQRYYRKSVDDPVGIIDVVPTILDSCKIPYYPNHFQGTSLLSLLSEKKSFSRKYTFSEHIHVKAIAILRFKLITSKKTKRLYDIIYDPGETNNLFKNKIEENSLIAIYDKLKSHIKTQVNENEGNLERVSDKEFENRKINLDNKTIERMRTLGYVQ